MDALLAMDATVVDSSAPRVPNVRKLRVEGSMPLTRFSKMPEDEGVRRVQSFVGDECMATEGGGMAVLPVVHGMQTDDEPGGVLQEGQVCCLTLDALESG